MPLHWDIMTLKTHPHPHTHTLDQVPWGCCQHNVIIIHRTAVATAHWVSLTFLLCSVILLTEAHNSTPNPHPYTRPPACLLRPICNPIPPPRTPISAPSRPALLQNKPAVLAGRVPGGVNRCREGRGASACDTRPHAPPAFSSNLPTHHRAREWCVLHFCGLDCYYRQGAVDIWDCT